MASGGIKVDEYGTTSKGEVVHRYTFSNSSGIQVQILSYGGIISSVLMPDKNGATADVTTGYDTFAEYEKNVPYFGALIGRVANRIDRGKFSLEGKDYQVAINNGPNHLHGGLVGFDKKVWKTSIDGQKLRLELVSPDGEENYPGQVTVVVTYELNDENELVIDYTATTDKTTPINLTNHAYFNLAGHKAANVYDQTITINADSYTPKTEDCIPTGELASVEGTLFDLRKPVKLGDRLMKVVEGKPGYDHNFCVSGSGHKKFAARLEHAESGRVMEVYTDQPGIQLYTGNYLDGLPGKDGASYTQHSSLALETQNYPDAINQANFPSCILKPGETYRHTTWYKFTTAK